MSFVDGFYSYNVDLTDSERNLYTSFRIKTPKHPYESLEHLFSRMLAFVHCYEEGQEFTRGLFEVKDPTIWKKDVLGNLLLWVQVGGPEVKKLKKALREDFNTRYLVYFFDPQQKFDFCHHLRGSKENWVDKVEFFEIDAAPIEAFAPQTPSSSKWEITIVDDTLYLLINGVEGQVQITPIDIWNTFQLSLSTEDDNQSASLR